MLAVSAGDVRIDEVTASLLDARFERRDGVLVARHDADQVRRLLGKVTPCVGRDRELAILDATLDECIGEPISRAVLVTAPAGIGKSRLRLEFVERARGRDIAVWTARADQIGAGSSLGLVRQLVRAGASLRESDSAREQQARLVVHLSRYFHGEALVRTCEFLGELVGARVPTPSETLQVARGDPSIMGEWMQRSFEQWIASVCAATPLLVVIEDLHWGDAPSVAYLDGVLRGLAEQPLRAAWRSRARRSTTSFHGCGASATRRRSGSEALRADGPSASQARARR